jgi:hypothetical protein
VPYVESSAVNHLHYDEVTAELHIEFAGDRAYVYYDVPRRVYDDMRTASSVGAYFNQHIKDRYRFRQTMSPAAKRVPSWRRAG